MWVVTCDTVEVMSSRHRNPAVNFRPDPGVKAQAKAALDARGHTIDTFLSATFQALAENPDAILDALAPHWPAPKPKGRPPKGEVPGQGQSPGVPSSS